MSEPSQEPRSVTITDAEYLADPDAAFAKLRDGVNVMVVSTGGCARMTLCAKLLSEVLLDD